MLMIASQTIHVLVIVISFSSSISFGSAIQLPILSIYCQWLFLIHTFVSFVPANNISIKNRIETKRKTKIETNRIHRESEWVW